VRLTVDGRRVQERTDPATARLLDVGSARLYLGGVGVAGRAAAVDARLASLLGPQRAAAGSLRGGCIRNFKVNFTFNLLLTYLLTYLSTFYTWRLVALFELVRLSNN